MINELKTLVKLEKAIGNGSNKVKADLIRENATPEFLYLLDIGWNPFVTTKLNKLEMPDIVNDYHGVPVLSWEKFTTLIEELKVAKAANSLLRERATMLLSVTFKNPNHESGHITDEEDLELRKMLMKILTKNMNIGVGAKLINKALGREEIPNPSLMLADDDPARLEGWPVYYCENKYDGVRVIARMNDKGEFLFYTRAFNEIDPTRLSLISAELKEIAINHGLKDIFFDGELTDFNRKSVSGKVTKILKGTAPADIDKGFLFNIFDIDENKTLDNKIGETWYLDRRTRLETILANLKEDSHLKLGDQWVVHSMEEILTIYDKIVADGGEGVIVKNNHLYECKRSKNWIKMKEVNDCDLIITGWYPGEGKREGLIGGFNCTDASGTMRVNVGSGFTDADLQTISQDPDSYIGRIIAAQYNEPIMDKHGNRSLFLPRLIDIRNDKTEADDLSELDYR